MQDLKLFNRWSYIDVKVADQGMERYIDLTPMIVPHSSGRNTGKQFSQSKMNIVERLCNKLMKSGQGTKRVAGKYIRDRNNTGKKQRALKIVQDAFEIIEKRTKKNPIQVLVDALVNTGPREATTSIIYGGIRYHKAVDVSTQRRVDFGLKNIALGAFATSFNNKKSIEESLADEIVWAATSDNKAYSVQRKEETERIAKSSR
mgnify:CR=1 FL=1